MGSLVLATRIFFRTLFSGEVARDVEQVLGGGELAIGLKEKSEPSQAAKPKGPIKQPKPARSDALTVLAALQRDARLIDLIKEPLTEYSDAQIGAAARDVIRDCGGVLDRMFQIEPLLADAEGDMVDVPAPLDPARIRLTGNVKDQPDSAGRLVHAGWIATRCEVPQWNGSDDGRMVVAPAEVEID